MFRLPIYLLAIAGLIVSIGAAAAHGYQQQPPPAEQQIFSEQNLKAYAESALEVEALNNKYLPELRAAETTEEQAAIRNAANNEMIEAIQAKGLTVEQYNQIATAAQTDPEIAQKVAQYIEAARN